MKVARRTFLKASGAGVGLTALSAGLPALLQHTAHPQSGGASQPAAGDERWVPSVCLQCPAGCGIRVRVVNGRAVKIEGNPLHPINMGRLCPKGQAGLQFLYDPDRIKGPMRRVGERGSGQWERISWDDAIAEVVSRLRTLREDGKAHQLLFMSGRNRGQSGALISRFLAAYGSPNDIGHSSICEDGSAMAHYATQGWKAYAGYDWDNTNYALIFGAGFIEAWRPTTRLLRAYGHIRRGRPVRGKIVVVDTRASVSAVKADEWVPLKPGTDGALALGIAHVILVDGLWDRAFVGDFTTAGRRFEAGKKIDPAEFKENMTLGLAAWWNEVLAAFTPEHAAGLCGVPAETIVHIAREFATTRPALAAGARGSSMQTNGIYNRMAIHALNALVGSIDAPGGVVYQIDPPFTKYPDPVQDDIAKAGVAQPRIDYAGTRRYPLAGKVYQNVPEFATGDGPYKGEALFLYYTNPFFSTPDVGRVRKLLAEVPFIVNFSPFMSESAAYSDLILPDHTYLERWHDDVIYPSLGYPVLGLRQPVVEPLYDTRNTWDVLLDIAHGLGGTVAQSFPWKDAQDILKFRCKGIFETKHGSIVADTFDEWWAKLVEVGVWANPPYAFGRYDKSLQTDSGKFEIRSGKLEHKLEDIAKKDAAKTGADPHTELEKIVEDLALQARGEAVFLPHFEPPRYAGDETKFPLLLNTYKLMTHAEGRGANVPWLQEIHGVHLRHDGTRWDSWLEINPETAARLGIEDGDEVWVESPVGRIRTRAKLYPGAQPDVVNMPYEQGHLAYGRWAADRGANPNWILVNEMDRLGGLAAFFSTRVRVYRA